MNTNEKDTPACNICKKSNVRIYRPYGFFYRPEDNRCNEHLEENERKYYIPCVIDKDGLPWGYTMVPKEDCDIFYNLPEAVSTGYGWDTKKGWVKL